MKEPILENKQLAATVIAGSGTISATHFMGYQWEHWIVWMTFAITLLILWSHFKAQVLRPICGYINAWKKARLAKRIAKMTKRRRAYDK